MANFYPKAYNLAGFYGRGDHFMKLRTKLHDLSSVPHGFREEDF